MTNTLTSRIFGPAPLRLVAAAALVCLLAHGASAQDNDDDGVLPVSGSASSGTEPETGSGNDGGGNQAASAGDAVLVAGDVLDETDPTAARIEFATTPGTTELISGAPAEVATFVADPPGIAGSAGAAGPSLQGSGLLYLHEGIKARFVAAVFAQQSVALLVLDEDGDSLKDELAGYTQPELVIPLGAAAPVDLQKLAAITAKYADVLPGYHATIVFVSAYAGELRVAGVRAHTDGGPIEVIAH